MMDPDHASPDAGCTEYTRIAGLYDYPGSGTTANPKTGYAMDGCEAAGIWRRSHLLEFEEALRTADRANGNNGEIGLPYFDWSALATTGGGGSVELKQADSTAEVDLLPKWFTEEFP